MLNKPSLPTRGEWIEICTTGRLSALRPSLPVRGEWIEISNSMTFLPSKAGLSPCGESGLKCLPRCQLYRNRLSLPVRGEWIETGQTSRDCRCPPSFPAWGEWIEIVFKIRALPVETPSLPARGEGVLKFPTSSASFSAGESFCV